MRNLRTGGDITEIFPLCTPMPVQLILYAVSHTASAPVFVAKNTDDVMVRSSANDRRKIREIGV